MSDVEFETKDAEAEMSPGPVSADLRVGRRIRALRMQRGRSLAEIAQVAGISIGALSQIERGLSSLKVKTLWPIAGALAVEPHSLLDHGEPPAHEVHIVRREDRRAIPVWSEGVSKDLLSPAGAALTGLHVRIEPGGRVSPYSHPGHEFGLVLTGEVELDIDRATATLRAGDSFAFKSTLPHAFRNPGAVPCEIVWVNTVTPLDVNNGV